jgi:ABC-type nickel/cobalt efflux system permease component RcnA
MIQIKDYLVAVGCCWRELAPSQKWLLVLPSRHRKQDHGKAEQPRKRRKGAHDHGDRRSREGCPRRHSAEGCGPKNVLNEWNEK